MRHGSQGPWRFCLMSFTYNFGANPPIDYPRFLCRDTVEFLPNGNRAYAFEDSEITMATNIVAAVWQSSMFFSGTAGVTPLSSPPTPWRRIGAMLLNGLASSSSKLSMITQILDVHMDASKAAEQLRADATELLRQDDEDGSLVIIEQVNDSFSFRDRWWNQWQRQANV